MSRTRLNQQKISTLAKTASFLVRQWHRLPDTRIAHEILREGLRKLHDCAESHRGDKKYLGHADWSKAALRELRLASGDIEKAKLRLRHEHVVPVKVVVDLMVELGRQATSESCEEVIRRFSRVAIITRDEDKLFGKAHLSNSMPEDWDRRDIWARYKLVGLYGKITNAKQSG